MDRVQCSECRLGPRARRQEQDPVERQQPERIDDLSGAIHQGVKIQSRIMGYRAPDRPWDLGQHELARHKVRVGQERPERVAFGFVAHELHERRRIRVEERHASALAADLVECATQSAGVGIHGERCWQSTTDGADNPSLRDQSIQGRADAGWRTELRDRSIAVGHEQPLPVRHPLQIATQILTQLSNANGPVHVHECSISSSKRSDPGVCTFAYPDGSRHALVFLVDQNFDGLVPSHRRPAGVLAEAMIGDSIDTGDPRAVETWIETGCGVAEIK